MAGGGSSGFGTGLWVCDIEKVLQGEYFTNRYILQALTMEEAAGYAGLIAGYERAIMSTAVLFTRHRVSDGQPNTDVYQVTNLNTLGLYAAPVALVLPLFNVVRCDFNTAGGGRPSRKYLRAVLEEENTNFNDITAARVTQITNSYVAPLIAMDAFVDVDGQQFSSGSVFPRVGMRQLRRASKRKAPTAGTTV
jgi:hypothetical protein